MPGIPAWGRWLSGFLGGLLIAVLPSGLGAELLPVRPVYGGLRFPHPYPIPHSAVSRKNLLGLKRDTPFGLPRPKTVSGRGTPVVIRILALRVEFQADDDPTTTGNGQFDLRSREAFQAKEGHDIDAAPHDRAYFERHLSALNAYYQAMSYGQLQLVWEVWPRANQSVYRLPRQMTYYGPDGPLGGIPQRITQLFYDTFTLADSLNPEIVFSSYDAFIVFHAGADLQSDLGSLVEPTPNDIPSLFARFGDDGPPIIVDGIRIEEALMMPETTSQDGRISGLNVTLAHEFGHQLGLPDLYNTRNSVTAVGMFSIMDLGEGVDVDTGEQIISGVLPTSLDGWSRAFLGWLQPLEVSGGVRDLQLAAVELQDGSLKAIKVPISPHEYFLIENRELDIDGDGVSFLDWEEGVIMGPSDAAERPNFEYDYLLPAPGLLIWHVDEAVAYQDVNSDGRRNFEENTLQWDESHRFLDLEEADGIQDLGLVMTFGDSLDLFYLGNNSAFTPDTDPDSRSYSGANSRISITNIGLPGLRLNLRVNFDLSQPGWPLPAAAPLARWSPVVGNIAGDQRQEVVVSADDGALYAWHGDGSPVITTPATRQTVALNGDTLTLPVALFAATEESTEAGEAVTFSQPALAPMSHQAATEANQVVAVASSGRIYAWDARDQDGDGRPDLRPGFPVDLVGLQGLSRPLQEPITLRRGAVTPPVVSSQGILVATAFGRLFQVDFLGRLRFSRTLARHPEEGIFQPPAVTDATLQGIPGFIVVALRGGRVVALDGNGQTLWEQSTGAADLSAPVLGRFRQDGQDALLVMVASLDGRIFAWDWTGQPLPGWPVQSSATFLVPPTLGDIDQDGRLEVFLAGSNRLYAWNQAGIPLANFSLTLDREAAPGPVRSAPILADLDGDRDMEILIGTADQRVFAFHHTGQPVAGFPLACGGVVTTTPATGDLDGDGDLELVVGAGDGYLYVWDLAGAEAIWPMAGHDAYQQRFQSHRFKATTTASDTPLLVAASVFAYPNPSSGPTTRIRYRLTEEARVTIRVYDLAGDLIDEFSGPGQRQQNEIPWDLAQVASGVYFCQIEARNKRKTASVICKVAVIK